MEISQKLAEGDDRRRRKLWRIPKGCRRCKAENC